MRVSVSESSVISGSGGSGCEGSVAVDEEEEAILLEGLGAAAAARRAGVIIGILWLAVEKKEREEVYSGSKSCVGFLWRCIRARTTYSSSLLLLTIIFKLGTAAWRSSQDGPASALSSRLSCQEPAEEHSRADGHQLHPQLQPRQPALPLGALPQTNLH